MAETNAIRAGKAYVEIFADNSMLIKGLKQAEHVLKSFGTALSSTGLKMMGLGAAITLPLLKAAQSAGHMGHELSDMAIRTGASVESLSALSYAANQTGTSMEGVEKGFKFMHKNLLAAKDGAGEAADSFKMLGIQAADLKNKTPDEAFVMLADRIGNLKDPTERAGMALKLFGRSGTELLPLFDLGAAGMAKMTAEARRLGLIMSTEDAQAASAFYEEEKKLVDVLKMGMFRVGSALIPVLRGVAEWITNVAVKITEWVKQNKDLVVQVLYLGTAILVGGAALFAFGKTLTVISGMIGGFLATVKLIGSAIAFILSPVGILIAAITGLGIVFFKFTEYGAQALTWLGNQFSALSNDAKAAFNAIGAALANGNIGLAAEILWNTIKVAFLTGKAWLVKLWASIPTFMLDAWSYALYGIRTAWAHTINYLIHAWGQFRVYWAAGTSLLAEGLLSLEKSSERGMVKRNRDSGKISKEEAEKQLKEIDERYAGIKAQLVKSNDEEILKAEKERVAANTKADADLQDAKKRAQDALDASLRANASGHQAEIDAANAQLEAARAKLSALEAQALSEKPAPGAPTPPKLDTSLGDTYKTVVRGTFNPNAMAQLGANTTGEKIEKNTRDTAAAINEWIRRMERTGGTQNNFA